MIDVSQAEKIHDILIEKFGGAKGIRDKGHAYKRSLSCQQENISKTTLPNTGTLVYL